MTCPSSPSFLAPALRPAPPSSFLSRRVALALLLLLVACPKETAPPVASGETTPTTQTPPASLLPVVATDLDATLPFDPTVRKGTLPNGLTWYVEPRGNPEKRVELWLAVRVGSAFEDPDQQGLAHLLEHMAFNGTTHFPGNTLITYLESVGTRFGAHLNAHTSFEETVYKLQVPTDDAELLAQGFVVLADWAAGMRLDDEEIEKERGVVLEEWRRSRGAMGRRRDATIGLQYYGAIHAERLPIGTEASLKTFTPEAVKRFYRDWYRPDLMAVFVVGDLDPDDAQARIAAAFSGLKGPAEARDRLVLEVPGHEETLVNVFRDAEITRSSVEILRKMPDLEGRTHRDTRDGLVRDLWRRGLSERLGDLSLDPEAPVQAAGVGHSRLNPTSGLDSGWATPVPGREKEALSLLARELERARRFGLLADELERAKRATAEGMRRSYADRDTQEARDALQELLRNFTNGEAVPGIAYELAMQQASIDTVTLTEVNTYGATFLGAGSTVALVSQPDRADVPKLPEADVRAVLLAPATAELEPPVAVVVPTTLVANLPTPAAVVGTQTLHDVGAVEWTFGNGARVILKTTDWKADEVRFSAFAPGGHADLPDADWMPARTARQVMDESGLAGFDKTQLSRFLAGRTASASSYIAESVHGMVGSAAPADLEVALQLAFLAATQPRFTDTGLAVARRSWTAWVLGRDRDPDTRLSDRFDVLLYPGQPRAAPPSLDQVAQMDRGRSEAVHRALFADFGQATFVFVGNVTPETLLPLVARWIGALPGGPRRPEPPPSLTLAPGGAADTVRAGVEQKARLRLRVSGERASTPESRHRLRTLGRALSIQLREELREARGGTYSVGASTPEPLWPPGQYGVVIDFQCDPARLDELRRAAMQILEQAKATPMEPSVAERVAEQERRGWETELRENAYWLNNIVGALQRGEALSTLAEARTYWERIDPAYVLAAAQEHLDLDRYVLVTLVPEPKKKGGK